MDLPPQRSRPEEQQRWPICTCPGLPCIPYPLLKGGFGFIQAFHQAANKIHPDSGHSVDSV
jgi:hypothetical protein